MSTLADFLTGSTQGRKLGNDVITIQRVLDFSVTNAGSGDIILALTPAKGDFVTATGYKVLTAGTAGSSITDVGDFLTASPYTAVAAVGWQTLSGAADALTQQNSVATDTYPALGGKLYDGTQSIGITLSAHAQTALKVVVWAKVSVVEAYANS
jgi:hypothetical protein